MVSTFKYITIPYEVMNCYQLARFFYKEELGIDLIDMSHIKDDATRLIHREILKQSINWKLTSKPELYDFVLMNNDDHHQIINHIGIYIGNNKVLHTSKATGAVVSDVKLLNIKSFARYGV